MTPKTLSECPGRRKHRGKIRWDTLLRLYGFTRTRVELECDEMRLIRRARRWWFRQAAVNPGRVDCWVVGFLGIIATVLLVAVVVRFIG